MAALLCIGMPATAGIYSMRVPVRGLNSAAQVTRTYATFNPADKGTSVTLSNGNLTDTSLGGSGVRGTLGKSSGKWYFEVTVTGLAGTSPAYPPLIGIAGATNPLMSSWMGVSEYLYYASPAGSTVIWSNNFRTTYGTALTAGDVIGMAVDLDNRQIIYYRNGVSQGVAFTSTTFAAGTYYPLVTDPNGGGSWSTTVTANFGQTAFKYSVPTGYAAGWYN